MTRNLFGQHGLEILPQSAISAISSQMRSSTRSLLSKVKESAQVLKSRSENKKEQQSVGPNNCSNFHCRTWMPIREVLALGVVSSRMRVPTVLRRRSD